jgi:hypothetical protein
MASSSIQDQGFNSAPGSGITGGYNGNSLAIKAVIAVFAGLSIYNAIELIALVFITFTRYKGVYFWSLLIASWGIIPYTLGFLLKFFEVTTTWDTVYQRVLAHDRVVHHGHWPKCGALESTSSACYGCRRHDDPQMDKIHDHRRRNYSSHTDNGTYFRFPTAIPARQRLFEASTSTRRCKWLAFGKSPGSQSVIYGTSA